MLRALGLLLAIAIGLWAPVPSPGQAPMVVCDSLVAAAVPPSSLGFAVIASMAPERPGEAAQWSVGIGGISVGVDVPDLREAGDHYSAHATVRVSIDGRHAASERIECAGSDYATIKIIFDGESARVLAGFDRQQEVAAGLPMAIGCGLQAVARATRPMLCRRLSVMSLDGLEPQACPVGDIDSRLRASDDPFEGYWTYLDRDLDTEAATLGAKYRLATVKRPDGEGYWIVYISGSGQEEGGRWQPGMVKGAMQPTIYAGHFDMQWLDARGVMLADDNTAQVSADRTMLILRFPLYGTQLRFARQATESE